MSKHLYKKVGQLPVEKKPPCHPSTSEMLANEMIADPGAWFQVGSGITWGDIQTAYRARRPDTRSGWALEVEGREVAGKIYMRVTNADVIEPEP